MQLDAIPPQLPSLDELDEIDAREIAHQLRRDLRTVRKVMRGEKVRGLAGSEIQRAIEQRRASRRGGGTSTSSRAL